MHNNRSSFAVISFIYLVFTPFVGFAELTEPIAYDQWVNAVKATKLSRKLKANDRVQHIVEPAEFYDLLLQATALATKEADTALWPSDAKPLKHSNFDQFDPHVQVVRRSNGHRFAFHGDFHGDIQSLCLWIVDLNKRGFMRGFEIIDPAFDLVFLGDYTDRGRYGVDVIYSVTLLKILNPDHVWLVRGNHEDLDLNHRYGLVDELKEFLGLQLTKNVQKFEKAIDQFYNTMPVAVFLGTQSEEKHILACHGGMEPGFDHSELLKQPLAIYRHRLGMLDRKEFVKQHRHELQGSAWINSTFIGSRPKPPDTNNLGFMWSDFTLTASEKSSFQIGRGIMASAKDSAVYMGKSVGAFFRGHQHSSDTLPRLNSENGILSHWHPKENSDFTLQEGMVLTFNLGADSINAERYKIDLDTYGVLTAAGSFKQWKVEVTRQSIL